jgi:hypothetical protein
VTGYYLVAQQQDPALSVPPGYNFSNIPPLLDNVMSFSYRFVNGTAPSNTYLFPGTDHYCQAINISIRCTL